MPRDPTPIIPLRIWMPDGAIHLIRRIALSAAAAEYPDATCIERTDRPTRRPIEDSNDG